MDDFEDWSDDELFLAVAGSQVPKEFPFPFEPYEIQKQLMAKIYEVLDLKKIGIFESPTGTGKSMSMICGALKWLTDFEAQKETEFKKLLDDITNDAKTCTTSNSKTSAAAKSSEPDWITNYSSKKSEKEELAKIQRERDIILKREQRLIELKKNLQAPTFHRKGTKRPHKEADDDAFTDFMQTADEQLKVEYEKEARQLDEDFLLNQMEADEAENSEGEEEDIYVTKIYFCSRTHSQLSQFVREVLKSPYSHTVRSVSLGSRQNMCINGDVNRLKSLTLINDRCKELQKNSSKKSTSETGKRRKQGGCCPYYNQSRIRHLTERALLEVKDIEDLVKTGKKVKACPYYAARRSVPASQLVVLPYNTLLHNSTRKASGIQLKDNIVIIDEAHNLLETISNIHSVEVFESQLVQALGQIEQYRDKYRSRLLPLNLLHVEQLINIMSEFIMYLNNAGDTKLLTVNDFLSACNLDNINFFALIRFCEKSQIARKLSGFVGHVKNKVKNDDEQCSSSAKAIETKQSGISSLLQKIKHSDTPSCHEAGELAL